jgi:hypothetical protein
MPPDCAMTDQELRAAAIACIEQQRDSVLERWKVHAAKATECLIQLGYLEAERMALEAEQDAEQR